LTALTHELDSEIQQDVALDWTARGAGVAIPSTILNGKKKVRAPGFEPWWVVSHWTVLPLDYKPNRI
jgi:hypothetical protein